MIAIDTSTFRRLLSGDEGRDVILATTALRAKQAAVPPLVVTELLSEKTLAADTRTILRESVMLPLHDGYWERAGELRGRLLMEGSKAKTVDCLIAQSCIDNDVPLITYDRDFRHFESAGLMLI